MILYGVNSFANLMMNSQSSANQGALIDGLVTDINCRRRVQERPKKPKCEDPQACGQALEKDGLPEKRSDCGSIDMAVGALIWDLNRGWHCIIRESQHTR